LGPVTSSASPAAMLKLNPDKTCRPPRIQAKSDAIKRIAGLSPPDSGVAGDAAGPIKPGISYPCC
jgi:hypothetical protein